jgi:hypothetical protein
MTLALTEGWRDMVVGWLAVLSCLAAVGSNGGADDEPRPPAVLREVVAVGATDRVKIEAKARGELTPDGEPGKPKPRPIDVTVTSSLTYRERTLAVGPEGRPRRVARFVEAGEAAIDTRDRPIRTTLRDTRTTLIAEARETSVRVFAPGGPLSRSELDLVEAPADPMSLAGLLSEKAVAVGDTWEPSRPAVQALTDYEALATSSVRARVESMDASTARIRLAGDVRGAVRGGEGTLSLDGTLTFDRVRGRIVELQLSRVEVRGPGQVEVGFRFEGTLKVVREPADTPPELTDAVLANLPVEASPGLLLLEFTAPDGRYRFLHDRDWHLLWDDTRMAVLKRLDRGEMVAQCNLSVGPNAGVGRHQDTKQFEADIRKAIGPRFVASLGAEELRDAPPGEFRYRVAVQGREGQQDILWYYYLIAGPEGDQLVATFTLNATDLKRLGDQDLQLVGTLEWGAAK